MRVTNIKEQIVELMASMPEELRDIRDYDHGYIDTLISEIANNNVPIYYSQLREIAVENIEEFEEMANTLGMPFDFYKTAQAMAYDKLYGEYTNYWRQIIELVALNEIANAGIEQFEKHDLENFLEGFNWCDRIEEIVDHAHDTLKDEGLKCDNGVYHFDYEE